MCLFVFPPKVLIQLNTYNPVIYNLYKNRRLKSLCQHNIGGNVDEGTVNDLVYDLGWSVLICLILFRSVRADSALIELYWV